MYKRNELEAYAVQKNVNIIAITETWATPDINDSEFCIQGYTLFRKDRSVIRQGRGGGVMLLVKNNISCVAYEKLNKLPCESLWIQIQADSKFIINLGVCYRSQTASVQENESMRTAILEACKEQCLIVGDFNYANINWETYECDKDGEIFLDLLQDNYLSQHVNVPTRGNNILDLVISSEANMVEDLKVIEHFATSDHNMVEFNLLVKSKVHDVLIYKYNFSKGNYDDIRNNLSEIDWVELFDGKDTITCYDIFCGELKRLIDDYVPKIKSKTKKRCLWLDRNVLKVIKRRNKKWSLYSRSKMHVDFCSYKKM